MRVPSDAANPTFDRTFRVGFGRWLTSSAADRREWARRRNAAAHVARTGQNTRTAAWDGTARQRHTPPARRAAGPGPAVKDPLRSVNRLASIAVWGANLQLVLLVGALAVGAAAVVAIVILLVNA